LNTFATACVQFCSVLKQAAAELRGSTSASMVASLGSAKQLRAGETDPATRTRMDSIFGAAQADAALHRKVSHTPLTRHLLPSRLTQPNPFGFDARRPRFTLLCGGAFQAMRAARLEANAAEADMRNMTASLKVRSHLVSTSDWCVLGVRGQFDCLRVCVAPQSLKRAIIRPDTPPKLRSAEASVNAGIGKPKKAKAASARRPTSNRMRPQPPSKRNERGYQSARGSRPVSLV
jgi:hypothetical protein